MQVYGALLRTLFEATKIDVAKVLSWCGMEEDDLTSIHQIFGNKVLVGNAVDFSDKQVSQKGVDIWRSFAKSHAAWQKANAINAVSLINLGVREWLQEYLAKPYTANNLMKAYALYAPRNLTLAERLKALAHAERMSRQKEEKAADVQLDEHGKKIIPIDLVTAHGCKGLEYDRVWIIGMDEGNFPSKDGSLEEERRLFYVAMTRAREVLSVSCTSPQKISIFITEAQLAPKKDADTLTVLAA